MNTTARAPEMPSTTTTVASFAGETLVMVKGTIRSAIMLTSIPPREPVSPMARMPTGM